MIALARIQGHSLGHEGWQRPIFPMTLGQNGAPPTSFGPPSYSGQGPSFGATPPTNPNFVGPQVPGYPPAYVYAVDTAPVVTDTPKPPPWALIAGGIAAGVVLALLLR